MLQKIEQSQTKTQIPDYQTITVDPKRQENQFYIFDILRQVSWFFSETNTQESTVRSATFFQKLLHFFQELSPELLFVRPDNQKEYITKRICGLLQAQYLSFFREALALPIQDKRMYILSFNNDQDRPIQLIDSDYALNVLTMCENGIKAALGTQFEERYKRELFQIEKLITLIQENLIANNPHGILNVLTNTLEHTINANILHEWRKTTLSHVSVENLDSLQLFAEEYAFVGPQFFFMLPATPLYPSNKSYYCLYTPYFIPRTGQIIIHLSQFCNSFSFDQHKEILEKLGVTQKIHTEQELMSHVIPLPQYISDPKSEQVFIHILSLIQEGDIVMREKLLQQSELLKIYSKRLPSVEESIQIMAQIVYEEFCRGIDKTTQPTLEIFHEIVRRCIEQNIPFNKEKVWEIYCTDYQKHRKETFASTPATKVRDSAIQSITAVAPEMGLLQQSFASKLDCAVGSFQSITTPVPISSLSSSMNLPSFSSSETLQKAILEHSLTREQQIAYIGKDSWEKDWHPGFCVNPHCSMRGHYFDKIHDTGVGPCNWCVWCQLEDDLKNFFNQKNIEQTPSMTDAAEENLIKEDPLSRISFTAFLSSFFQSNSFSR